MIEYRPQLSPRLHCLDWLRVFAIGILVFYHIGMVYVPDWGYHFKNQLNNDGIKSLMLLTSPWRMGLLWIISGMSFAHMCKGKSLFALAIKRSNQILLPLLVGVLFIVPVQLFVQMKQAGDMPLNFTEFVYAFYIQPKHYFAQYTSGIWPRFDVNHLWFLRSLWRFSMVILILSPLLQSKLFKKYISLIAANVLSLVLLIATPVVLVDVFFEGEEVREYYGFALLLLGFCLGMETLFWHTLAKHLRAFCILSCIVMLGLQIGFVFIWQSGLHQAYPGIKLLFEGIYLANKVLPLLAILALAYRFLNIPNKLISSLNPYVFGLYILHQSVIILIAYLATTSAVPFLRIAEYQIWVNIVMTPLVCAILLITISRINILRICFGMRWKNNTDPYQHRFTSAVVFAACLPLVIALVS
ncbi:MAG: peptidoglycan/LPS O-acetylase OafA/YrhL [Glaciecola sp.]|jgi:peptidoglycan/LPS O-acetylase OafA/YrhL